MTMADGIAYPKVTQSWTTTGVLGSARVDREVSTERNLFNAHGTF